MLTNKKIKDMKHLMYLSFALLLAAPVLLFTSCDDDEGVEISCNDGIQNGDETDIDCGGSCDPCPTCDDGIQNGDETGVDCGGSCDACFTGVQGQWESSGTNVAPLLVAFFNVDSLWADFRTDGTYTVHQFDTAGVQTVLEGTYIQTESGVGDIFNITVNQSSPAVFTSVGILEVTEGEPDVMKYEIVLDDGVNVPPTAEAGFGSTNGGAFGEQNVQTYLRLK
jgi:hypothetical protein